VSQRLPYLAMDADIHYDLSIDTPETIGQYVDADMRDAVTAALNARQTKLAGGSDQEGAFHMPGAGTEVGRTVPGAGLVKMNPLTGLSEEERAVVALRFGGDLTLSEIAELLGERQSTIEGRLYRGLRRLRETVS